MATQKAMGPVAAALGEYLTARKPEFKSMAERIPHLSTSPAPAGRPE
ncbi:hypothetical protein [Streptomyces yangpuensis]|nr:hypothetical protein [Streptomyces yangpuensis]